jgi:hypothetical protein
LSTTEKQTKNERIKEQMKTRRRKKNLFQLRVHFFFTDAVQTRSQQVVDVAGKMRGTPAAREILQTVFIKKLIFFAVVITVPMIFIYEIFEGFFQFLVHFLLRTERLYITGIIIRAEVSTNVRTKHLNETRSNH